MVEPTPEAQVRLLIADNGAEQLFTDEQLSTFLAITEGSVYRASAHALRAIAVSEVLISKKIRTQDLSTDGPAVAAELRALAKEFEDRASDAESFFSIIPNFGYCKPEAAEMRYF